MQKKGKKGVDTKTAIPYGAVVMRAKRQSKDGKTNGRRSVKVSGVPATLLDQAREIVRSGNGGYRSVSHMFVEGLTNVVSIQSN